MNKACLIIVCLCIACEGSTTQNADSSATGSNAQGSGSGSGNINGDGGTGSSLPPVPIANCSAINLDADVVEVTLPAGCSGANCDHIGFTPLIDMGADTYQGLEGGLYCGGSNTMPPEHKAAGLEIAQGIEPLNAQGSPDANGNYALVSIGMSNTTGMFSQFIKLFDEQKSGLGVDPHLVVVDGAQGSQATQEWLSFENGPWDVLLNTRLPNAGVTAQQVQIAWIKLARKNPSNSCRQIVGNNKHCFAADAKQLAEDIQAIILEAKKVFPNLKMVYLTSRIYAGWATGVLNPEPYAYQSAFSVKHLVLEQMTGNTDLNYDAAHGEVKAPWLAWGPYIWADGVNARSDGYSWPRSDLSDDGTHPSEAGYAKNAQALLDFFTSDETSRQWLLETP